MKAPYSSHLTPHHRNNPKGSTPELLVTEGSLYLRRSFLPPDRAEHAALTLFRNPEAVLTVMGLVGALFNAAGSAWGFVIWLPGNIGFAVLNWRRGYKWQAALFAAYAITAIWGITQWRR